MNLEQYILEKLHSSRIYKTNRYFLRKDILKKYNVFDELISKTSFLGNNATPHQRFLCIEKKITFIPPCPCCGNPLPFNYDAKSDDIFMHHCSIKCANSNPKIIKKRKQNCIKIYGVENPSQLESVKQKTKQTNLRKYGVACTLQTEESRRAIKKLNMEKHGHRNPMQNPSVIKKAQETMLKRYGKKHALQVNEFVKKAKATSKRKYGVESIAQRNLSNKTIDILNNKTAFTILLKRFKNTTLLAEHLSVSRDCVVIYANKYNCLNLVEKRTSLGEKEIIKFLKTLSVGKIVTSDRKILQGKELDIYLPEHNLAIEFDGIYWHSTNNCADARKMKRQHIQKTEECEKQGIQLLHVWENEWNDLTKRKIWKSTIAAKLGRSSAKFMARKTKFVELNDKELVRAFLSRNHLQESCGYKKAFGLLDEKGNIVCVATFGACRFNKNYEWELLRFCTLTNTSVIGGFSKIIAHCKLGGIISYANRRWSSAVHSNLYVASGWVFVNKTPPNYFYTQDYLTLESRHKYQKHKLNNLLPVFSNNLTETENMMKNNYRIIYDCGNLVFSLNNTKSI